MAQQDKTDFYWNGELAGAVNNLYYDLINVDVVHVPYATNHRNSSFFLKTRLPYGIDEIWSEWQDTAWYEVTDVKIVWDDNCSKEDWTAYALWKKWKEKAIFATQVHNWCVWVTSSWETMPFFNCSKWCHAWEDDRDYCPDLSNEDECSDWKLFVTDFVKWTRRDWKTLVNANAWETISDDVWIHTWIQINRYNLWTTLWYFSDENIENKKGTFQWPITTPGNYLLVYDSQNGSEDWFAWQVRMITGTEDFWGITRIQLDLPWSWFGVIDTSSLRQWEEKMQMWWHVSYAVFTDWWDVIWFADNNKIYLLPTPWDCKAIRPYIQETWGVKSDIVSVVSTNGKIFILDSKWYVQYNSWWWWLDKFHINAEMDAWENKSSLIAYRDMILAFWRKNISIWVPDEQNMLWTMYKQSATIWAWSRYSYNEYDWALVLVSNDKRLLRLWVEWNVWRYMLQMEDIWEKFNWKLSALIPWDEVFVWSDNNILRIFVNTKPKPYEKSPSYQRADFSSGWNTMTHIYKYDTLFQVYTEDHVKWNLIKGLYEWIYYWERWIYNRIDWIYDIWWNDFQVDISAYLIENENNWLEWHPTLFNLAKLNRLITILWPWVYSNNSKIKITTYSKWIGYVYEFPINWDWNDWVWLITSYYLNESLSSDEREKIECMLTTLQDSQKQYQPNCPNWDVLRQYITQTTPWCNSYTEMLTESHGVCINDKLYEIAPTMPLTTDLWENQQYSTQIKLELIWWKGDIICFGWWLAELFIAPLFQKWPDWEYQLQPNTDC